MGLNIWKSHFSQFIKFGIVGLSNTFISYFIYVGLAYLGMNYLLAHIIAFFISVTNSWFWNSRYVFKESGEKPRVWWKSLLKTFVAYAWTGILLSNVLLVIYVEIFHLSKYISPLLSLIITVPVNFLVNKFWTFKSKNKEANDAQKN